MVPSGESSGSEGVAGAEDILAGADSEVACTAEAAEVEEEEKAEAAEVYTILAGDEGAGVGTIG